MWVGAKPAQSPFARLSATARRSRLRACGDGSCRVADIAELSLIFCSTSAYSQFQARSPQTLNSRCSRKTSTHPSIAGMAWGGIRGGGMRAVGCHRRDSEHRAAGLATKSGLRARNRSSDRFLGALFVADFQVLEFREVGKLLVGNAHRLAGLSQGADELVGLLLARKGDVETHERLDRDLGIFLLQFRDGRGGVTSTCAAARKTRGYNWWPAAMGHNAFVASIESRYRLVKK
jgi:hypothetical protein